MIVSETNLEVRYYETDLMGIVHHSNYIRYFECGRHKMLVDIGMPIEEIEKRGYMIPVISVKCTYKIPAKMGEILRIVTKIENLPLVKIIVKAEIYNSNNEIVAIGEVSLGVIHSDSRRPTRVPEFFLDAMKKYF